MESRPPAHLLLQLPNAAVGVCDLVGFVTGGAVRWAAASLSGVLLSASGAALGLGGAGIVAMSVPLTPSAAEGEGVVEPSGMADVVNGDGFGNVGRVGGENQDGGGVDRCSADGDDALRRQLLSELGKWGVAEEVANNGYLGGVEVSMEGKLYVVA